MQGPPGTGKTKTLLALLSAVHHRVTANKGEATEGLKKKILVCAPSNAAVDEIASRVLKEGLAVLDRNGGTARPSCVRIGNPWRITRPEVLEISLQKTGNDNEKQQKDDFFSKKRIIGARLDALAVEIAAMDSLRQAEEVQASFGGDKERPVATKFEELLKQRNILHHEKTQLKEEFEKQWKTSKSSQRDSLLRDADIVFATLSSSATESLLSVEFECIVTGKKRLLSNPFLLVYE